jgi:hypothetical protein
MAPSWVRKSDAAVAGIDQVSTAEVTSPLRSADGHPVSENGAQVVASKPSCLGASRPDGNCISFPLPKIRMVRVTKLPAPGAGQHGNSAKSGVPTAPGATKVDKGIAEPKKAQRTAHRQHARRTQPSARGYASMWRGEYARQGFAQNYW